MTKFSLVDLFELENLAEDYLPLCADLWAHLLLHLAEVLQHLDQVHGTKILHQICQIIDQRHEKLNPLGLDDATGMQFDIGVLQLELDRVLAREFAS